MANVSLYELDAQLEATLNELYSHIDDDGSVDIPEDISEQLETLQIDRRDKIEGITLYIKSQIAMADAIKAEEKALAIRRKQHEAKAESLKKYLASSMQRADETKFETARCKLSFRKSETLEIIDESLIPLEYKTAEIVYTISKNDIKTAIKEGKEIDGAVIITKQNLQIK